MIAPRSTRGVARWVFETRRRFNSRTRTGGRDYTRASVATHQAASPVQFSPLRKAAAWLVHAYTSMGLVCASAMAVQIFRGDAVGFRTAFLWMVVATIIDATDGYLARKVGVKQVLPGFDGRRLDDITDFLTYTFLPLVLLWRADTLPAGQEAWLIFPLLASAYGFCQADIKTGDGFFLGFPSLWNVVALYLYLLEMPGWLNLLILIALSVLTFVPTRYLYPSQPGTLNRLACVLGFIWMISLVPLLWELGSNNSVATRTLDSTAGQKWLLYATLFYPVFYLGTSFWVTLRLGRRGFGHTSNAA